MISPLTRDFLAWIASTPRTYTEAMDAWRSSCPRFTIWEDALAADLIAVQSGAGLRLSQSLVILTPSGRALLDSVDAARTSSHAQTNRHTLAQST